MPCTFNLSPDLIERRLQGVLEEISRRVEAATAGIVVVDSFRTVLRGEMHEGKEMALQTFMQQLAQLLTVRKRPHS
jgi:circadian clock protein KaiC